LDNVAEGGAVTAAVRTIEQRRHRADERPQDRSAYDYQRLSVSSFNGAGWAPDKLPQEEPKRTRICSGFIEKAGAVDYLVCVAEKVRVQGLVHVNIDWHRGDIFAVRWNPSVGFANLTYWSIWRPLGEMSSNA
jgi:hypothetical protein